MRPRECGHQGWAGASNRGNVPARSPVHPRPGRDLGRRGAFGRRCRGARVPLLPSASPHPGNARHAGAGRPVPAQRRLSRLGVGEPRHRQLVPGEPPLVLHLRDDCPVPDRHSAGAGAPRPGRRPLRADGRGRAPCALGHHRDGGARRGRAVPFPGRSAHRARAARGCRRGGGDGRAARRGALARAPALDLPRRRGAARRGGGGAPRARRGGELPAPAHHQGDGARARHASSSRARAGRGGGRGGGRGLRGTRGDLPWPWRASSTAGSTRTRCASSWRASSFPRGRALGRCGSGSAGPGPTGARPSPGREPTREGPAPRVRPARPLVRPGVRVDGRGAWRAACLGDLHGAARGPAARLGGARSGAAHHHPHLRHRSRGRASGRCTPPTSARSRSTSRTRARG